MLAPWPFEEVFVHGGAAFERLRQLDRGARAPQVIGAPKDGYARMRALDLMIVGQGSVGGPLTDYAAQHGVRSLYLVDPSTLKPESLLTHNVRPSDVGRLKVEVAGIRAKLLSQGTHVEIFAGPFQELPSSVVAGLSAVLLAPDNLACEAAVSAACVEFSVPLIQASVYGPGLTAQVRSIANDGTSTASCLVCPFTQQEWTALERGTRFSCVGELAASRAPEPERAPTVSPPQLCAMAASLALTEVTNRVLGLREPGASAEISYHGATHQTVVAELHRRESCRASHQRASLREWKGDLADARVRDLLVEAVGTAEALDDVSVAVEGYRFAGLGFCRCAPHPRIGGFRAIGADPDRCTECGDDIVPHPMYVRDVAPARVLAPHLDRTLGALGATTPGAVRVRRHPHATLFYVPRPGGVPS